MRWTYCFLFGSPKSVDADCIGDSIVYLPSFHVATDLSQNANVCCNEIVVIIIVVVLTKRTELSGHLAGNWCTIILSDI